MLGGAVTFALQLPKDCGAHVFLAEVEETLFQVKQSSTEGISKGNQRSLAKSLR